MRDYSEMRAEYAQLVDEAKAVIERCKAENRDLTTKEKAENDSRFAKGQTIQLEMKQVQAEQYDGPVKLGRDSHDPKCSPHYQASNAESSILRFNDSQVKRLGHQPNKVEFSDMLRAMVLGPKTEAERFALVNSSDSTGGFQLSDYQSASLLDGMRGMSILARAGAGFVNLDCNTRIAQLTTDPAPSWRAEGSPVTVTQSFGSGTLSPKMLGVVVKCPRELLEDAVNAHEAINSVTARAMSEQVDAASLFGSGGVEPLGVANQPGVQVVPSTANGSAMTNYNKILDAILAVQTRGYNPSAVIMSPRESRTINGFSDSTGQPLRGPGSLQNLPLLVSPKVPVNQVQGTSSTSSTILVGDFHKVLVGVKSPLRVEVLKETYADTYSYGFLFSLRLDIGLVEAGAIAKIVGITG